MAYLMFESWKCEQILIKLCGFNSVGFNHFLSGIISTIMERSLGLSLAKIKMWQKIAKNVCLSEA